ncbi:GSCFA domain-containing protein [Reyranella sp.]|uniref:GSCFA domain-containing protein n=1 Tax=Reyranella sp. TaxID=1929291 RepID=UPI003D112648
MRSGAPERTKRRRPGVRFLLTVSPVPLKASASQNHVLAATTYSKSVLRAVAGQLADTYDDVDLLSFLRAGCQPVVERFLL